MSIPPFSFGDSFGPYPGIPSESTQAAMMEHITAYMNKGWPTVASPAAYTVDEHGQRHWNIICSSMIGTPGDFERSLNVQTSTICNDKGEIVSWGAMIVGSDILVVNEDSLQIWVRAITGIEEGWSEGWNILRHLDCWSVMVFVLQAYQSMGIDGLKEGDSDALIAYCNSQANWDLPKPQDQAPAAPEPMPQVRRYGMHGITPRMGPPDDIRRN